MLSISDIHAFYGETQVLFGVSIDVAQGEVVALLGPNGAGKTTTLRSILNLASVRSGRISFDGRNITQQPTHEIARAGIGWVPDDRRVFPTLTVDRNLAIAKKRTRFRAWSERECFEIFSASGTGSFLAAVRLAARLCPSMKGMEMYLIPSTSPRS